MALLLGQGHFGEGATGAGHLEDRVVAKALIAAGCSGNQPVATPLNFHKNIALGIRDAQGSAEVGPTIAVAFEGIQQFLDPCCIGWA